MTPLTFNFMGNTLRNWGTAATLASAALMQAGCKDAEKFDKPDRPVASVPGGDVPRVKADTADALHSALSSCPSVPQAEQPAIAEQGNRGNQVAEKKDDPEVQADTPAENFDLLQEKDRANEYGDVASAELFKLYASLAKQLDEQVSVDLNFAGANAAVRKTKERMHELARISTPEFSEAEIEQIKAILEERKMHFVYSADNASRAFKHWAKESNVDTGYPQLSLSPDKRSLTFTVVLHSNEGEPSIPHQVTVEVVITKEGVPPGSVKIRNDFPVGEGSFHPEYFESAVAKYFGEIMKPSAEELKAANASPDTAGQLLIAQYDAILDLLAEEQRTHWAHVGASGNVTEAVQNLRELGSMSPPEYSEEELEKLRAFLINAKSTFISTTTWASKATLLGEEDRVQVDKEYPRLSLSPDQKTVTVTILLGVPHQVSVTFQFGKLGIERGSTVINNPKPINGREPSPSWFEEEMGKIFGVAEFPEEETKAE